MVVLPQWLLELAAIETHMHAHQIEYARLMLSNKTAYCKNSKRESDYLPITKGVRKGDAKDAMVGTLLAICHSNPWFKRWKLIPVA